MNVNAKQIHCITLELDDGEIHNLWLALFTASEQNTVAPTVFTRAFAENLADTLNIVLSLGKPMLRDEDRP